MAEEVNHTFSSSNTLIEDLKKKIKVVEKELETIASTVKDLSVSFPLIGQKEKEKKQLLLQLQSMQESRKEAAQAILMHVQMPYQPRQLLYKDLAIPLTLPFSLTSQNLQPLVMTHPSHNPFRPSGILPSIIRPVPSQLVLRNFTRMLKIIFPRLILARLGFTQLVKILFSLVDLMMQMWKTTHPPLTMLFPSQELQLSTTMKPSSFIFLFSPFFLYSIILANNFMGSIVFTMLTPFKYIYFIQGFWT